MPGASGGSSNSDRFLIADCPVESYLPDVTKKRILGSCGSECSSWFLGAVIWKKVRILDSVLLVHSKIAMISDNNYALNKNGFMKMLPPPSCNKNASSRGGGGHFRLPCVSTPHCFNVNLSTGMRRGLTQNLATVLILPKQLLARAPQIRNQLIVRSYYWCMSPPP